MPGCGTGAIEFLSQRPGESGKAPSAQRGSRAQRQASAVWLPPDHRFNAAGGLRANAKRVTRIRREEGLKVSKRQRRMRRLGLSTAERQRAQRPRQVLSWDFVEDQTENGSRFRILTLIDEYTRESLAIHAAWSIRAVDVIMVLEVAIARYGAPEHLRSDNGPEFIAYAIVEWLAQQKIKTIYITPGSRWENGHIESFHDKLRDECLNRELFGSLLEARIILEFWRVEYNAVRPHSSLGYRTPNQYAQELANQFDGGCAPPNPAPLAAAGVRGELINATRWQTNNNQSTKEPAELQL
jgi:putative transposase